MFHYYSKPSANRVSFAGEYQDGVLRIAAARTSKKDVFVRKKGRAIAEGRLKKGRTIYEEPISDFEVKEFVRQCAFMAKQIAEDPKFLELAEPKHETAVAPV